MTTFAIATMIALLADAEQNHPVSVLHVCAASVHSDDPELYCWSRYYRSQGYDTTPRVPVVVFGPVFVSAQFPPPPRTGGRVMFAPVFVSPQMQWAVPNSTGNGLPSGDAPPGTYGMYR